MKKFKRLVSSALAMALGLTATFNLAACALMNNLINSNSSINQSESSACTHVFGEWTLSQGATSCKGAILSRVCTECGDVEEKIGTEDDHVLSYEYDNTHHWTVCALCNEASQSAIHEDNGAGCCRFCEFLIPSACVYYELSADGSYAIVTGYDEAETDLIVIASSYENVPVQEIQAAAFEGCISLSIAFLPDTITTIGENAFSGCKKLMGIYLSKNVTTIEANAFKSCSDLTIFTAYDKDNVPTGWHEACNPNQAYVVWNHDGKKAANVSAKATPISDAMLRQEDQDRTQILSNPNLGNLKAPLGFSRLSRFDAKTTPPGTPWTSGNLWHHNWDQTKLTDYKDVWFAAKLQNANWVYTHNRDAEITPASWLYIHLTQTGETWDGYTLWRIETSIGGYVCTTIEGQTGRYYDENRPTNSIARLLWDEGFSSPDGSSIMIYNFIPEGSPLSLSIYCTEVVGIKKSA